MTFEVLEARYLSLRSWLWGCVLPGALCVFGLLMVLGYGTNDITQLNHNAVIIGFFGLFWRLCPRLYGLIISDLPWHG